MPAQSLDLTPIETLWAIIKQKLSQYRLKSLNELKEIIVREWQNLIRIVSKIGFKLLQKIFSMF